MNKIILMGRVTRDPDVRYSADNKANARFSFAVNRRFKREGEEDADFFNIVAFGRLAEFVEKYLHRGTKIVLEGEIHNNNYTNKDGQMIYGMQIIAQNIEFAESKASASNDQGNSLETPSKVGDGFMNIPEGMEEELPFN